MSGREMSEERDERPSEDDPQGDSSRADDVEILGIEAVDETEQESGAFDLVGAGEPDEEEAPTEDDPRGEELMSRLAKAEDRHLRLLADFDNFRKRAERERQESSRHVLAAAIRELLPVADNLERALSASGGSDDLRQGVEMIGRQFLEILRKLDVEPVPAIGEVFDPRVHEAVQRTETTDVLVPTVVEEFQRGYVLRGRLIRPALVRVALPPEAEIEAGSGGTE